MQNAVPLGEGGMAALVGANREAADKLCEEISQATSKVLEVSLLNSPAQIVISGAASAIEDAVKKGREYKIRRVVPLEVSGPFHCSMLKPAGDELKPALERVEVKAPQVPVISNVSGEPVTSPEKIRANLVAQVSQTVRWADCVQYALNQGANSFIEEGGGSVRTGILKKIAPEAESSVLEQIEDIEVLMDPGSRPG
jgi:[acyl-carrier-protein] S-malonyltransferase